MYEDVFLDDLIVLLRNSQYGLEALKILIDALPNDADIGNLPWDELLFDHTTAGSAGKKLGDIPTTPMRGTDDALLAADYTPERGTDDAFLATDGVIHKAVIDAIKAKTDNLPADPADESLLEAEINANETKIDIALDRLDHATYGLSALNTKILNILNKDSSPAIKAYPYNNNNATLYSGSTLWAWGNWAEIIPANTIDETFWIIGLHLMCNYVSTAYILLEVGIGDSGYEVSKGDLPYSQHVRSDAGVIEGVNLMFPIPIKVDANTRFVARVADSFYDSSASNTKVIYATGL